MKKIITMMAIITLSTTAFAGEISKHCFENHEHVPLCERGHKHVCDYIIHECDSLESFARKEVIKEIQRKIKCTKIHIDGVWGQETVNAIKSDPTACAAKGMK